MVNVVFTLTLIFTVRVGGYLQN